MQNSKKKQTGQLLYAVDEKPPPAVTAGLSLQVLLLIIAPITVTPLVVVKAAGLSAAEGTWVVFAALLTSGLTTLLQVRRIGPIGSGYLLFMGTSGAFLAATIPAAKVGGFALVATLALCAMPFQFLFGRLLGIFRKIVTPLVSGVTVMLIVISILPIALDLMSEKGSTSEMTAELWIVLFTLIPIILISLFAAPRLRMWSPVIGMLIGCTVAGFLGMLDLQALAQARWIGLPDGSWPGVDLSFQPEFWVILPAFILVTLVGAFETIGDTMAVQRVSQRNFCKIDYESVQGSIYADGIGNGLAGLLGTVPNTTYSNLVSLTELTGVASRQIGYWCGLGLIALAFLPKLGALITAIPDPVVGAFLFILMAMLFVTGIRLVASSGLGFESSIIVGVSFWIGYAFQAEQFFPELIPAGLRPLVGNGMVVGSICAVITSALFEFRPRPKANARFAADTAQLPGLVRFLERFADRARLQQNERFGLQLAAEEMFIHLCQERESPGVVTIKVEAESQLIGIEMIDRLGNIAEIDAPLSTPELTDLETSSPEKLGLHLLASLADDVSHLKVSGVHYLSVNLPRD